MRWRAIPVVWLAVTALVAGTLRADAVTAWSIANSPAVSVAASDLNGIACASTTSCWAVGSDQIGYGSTAKTQTLIEHYNGTSWKLVPSPNPSSSSDTLSAVACPSTSVCWAVGSHATTGTNYSTLIEEFNGHAWVAVSSPPDPTGSVGAALNGISCASATACTAVGAFTNGTVFQNLSDVLSGATWSAVAVPDTSSANNNQLNAVSCVTASDCIAAGFAYVGIIATAFQTLTEHYNGSAWTVVASADHSGAANVLNAVSCTASNRCVATGYYNSGRGNLTLTEVYNGASWSIVMSPNAPSASFNALVSVACTASTACWAAGLYADTGHPPQTLIEQFNGSSWSLAASPNHAAANNVLNAIACPSATVCLAAGSYNAGSVDHTLIERYNGTAWSIATSANDAPVQGNALNAVTCLSSTTCWAAGYFSDGVQLQTLALRFNGKTWSVVPSANHATSAEQMNLLYGITCVGNTDCWAVGTWFDGSAYHDLIEQYNGTSWSLTASPDPARDAMLESVSCASASECIAVGRYFDPTFGNSVLLERYDGTSWTATTYSGTLNPGTQGNSLWGSTCVSATDCWAVGDYRTNTAQLTLAEQFNGTSWSVVASPNSGTAGSSLRSVACTSSSNCWAVGNVGQSTQTLVEEFNGTAWQLATTSGPGTGANGLAGVSCAAANACAAVGDYNNGANDFTLVEQFGGVGWSVATSPNKSTTVDNVLQSVSCTSSSNCWAVGTWSDNTGHYAALIEHGP